MTKSPNKVSSANYSQNWSIPNFEQLSTDEKASRLSRGPQNSNKQVNTDGTQMFRAQTAEARNRQAALESYTDSRSQSVVARIAQIEVDGLRRRESVPVDEEALQNYAYQDNDTSFQEANFARLNRYISANHNDIYLKALRNKASSLVGENGQNITPRMFPNNNSSVAGSTFSGQSSSYLGGIKGNSKQISTSYPSYQSYSSNGGAAVVSRRIVNNSTTGEDSTFVTAQQARNNQAHQAAMAAEGKFVSAAQAQSQAARFALEGQQRAQQIADMQRAAAMSNSIDEESDKILLNNSNTFIVSNSPFATAEYENSERLYEEEIAANKDKVEENLGPRTVISVYESSVDELPEEVTETDYVVYSDDEIDAPEFLTESVSYAEDESEVSDQFIDEVDTGETSQYEAVADEAAEYAEAYAPLEESETEVIDPVYESVAEQSVPPEIAPAVQAESKVAPARTQAAQDFVSAQQPAEQPARPRLRKAMAEEDERPSRPRLRRATVEEEQSKVKAKAAPKARATKAEPVKAAEPQRRLRRRVDLEDDGSTNRIGRRRSIS